MWTNHGMHQRSWWIRRFLFLVIQKQKSSNKSSVECVPMTVLVIQPKLHWKLLQPASCQGNMKLILQNLQNNITANFTSRGGEEEKNIYIYEVFFSYIFYSHFFRKKIFGVLQHWSVHTLFFSTKLHKALMSSDAE